MKPVWPLLAMVALGILLAWSPAGAQTCTIGGHNETSENFATGGWGTFNMSPGTVPGAPFATHLIISEVAPRGAGTGAASDSSEYVEIFNPTPNPISLNGKYLSDDIGYYRVVNGPYAVANNTDFNLKFPTGLSLLPGRTLVVCVTKTGFAGSGASAAAAQIFLEMKDSNANTADDMVNVATGSTFPVTGGMFTNPSGTNGEWVVLYCWDGASDRVCDVDYASWGANSASNPKVDKSGISIDGPDAGAAASAYNADTPAATQTNLGSGTALTKPNTYQRTGGENGEVTSGGNGCLGIITPTVIGWVPVLSATGVPDIRFQVRFTNSDDDASSGPATGQIRSQEFGAFLPDFGTIGDFQVPPLQPSSFFDVFIEVPLSSLPPQPEKRVGDGGGNIVAAAYPGKGMRTQATCPPDTNWAGNVDIQWTSTATGLTGHVNKHYSDLLTCAGGAPSYIHFRPSDCTSPMPWSVTGLCPGFTATLVNEDYSAAPNPVPVGWSGWIQIQAAAASLGSSCCFGITFGCNGATTSVDICTFACQCQTTPPPNPQPGTIGWSNVPGSTDIRFHVRWTNPSSTTATAPASGQMHSQDFGVFRPSFGPIGNFNIPPIAPSSFFDVFFDVPLTQLPPSAAITGGPANIVASSKGRPEARLQTPPGCPPDSNWAGNVDLAWSSTAGNATVNYHFGGLNVCPGSGNTFIHVRPVECPSGTPAGWTIAGLCPGFSATLVNEDYSPAPNPAPPGWSGYISVSAAAGTPIPVTCCFTVTFVCDGVPGVINVCATTCQCQTAPNPVPSTTDWTTLPGGVVQFHTQWTNPSNVTSAAISGTMHSQEFGVFLPNAGTIGTFSVPPLAPSSFFDVFLEVPLAQLPPQPPTAGGPGTGGPCPPETHWDGNVDLIWNGAGGPGELGKHIGDITLCAGGGPSRIHIKSLLCPSTTGMPWSISSTCPGVTAILLNEDLTGAPNPVPPGWTGWISVQAAAGTPAPDTCCFRIVFLCDGIPGTIELCANICNCQATQPVSPQPGTVDWTNTATGQVRFHIRWTNPSQTQPTSPASGHINSQAFGLFLPDFGPIGTFDVPPMQPNSFFDVFFDVDPSALPPLPPKRLVGGGPQPGNPNCPPDNHWDGNVDIVWNSAAGTGTVNKHYGAVLLNTGGGNSMIHVISGCTAAGGSTWTLSGLCPGFNAVLLNFDMTPAPAVLPPNWDGWLSLSAPGTPAGSACCVDLTLTCGGISATIQVCATVCYWGTLGVEPEANIAFGIRSIVPNPASGPTSMSFALPKAGPAKVEVFDAAGHRVRTVVNGAFGAGAHTVVWDSRDGSGHLAKPGTYFIRLSAGGQNTSRKFVLRP